MKTFSIETLGCKVNQYESQQIRELLNSFGLKQIKTAEKPDLVVVNTCCVTHTASSKSRQQIRKARRFNPQSQIVVCGCLPVVNIGEINTLGKNICLVASRKELAETLRNVINDSENACKYPADVEKTHTMTSSINHNLCNSTHFDDVSGLPALTSYQGQTRAFLKVQDGCDGNCTYCIVPKTRPIVHSKPADKVLKEARRLVKAGHKEIVVTGVFLGAYGQDSVRRSNWQGKSNDNLAELLDRLAQIPDRPRIRLSSLEPEDLTKRLLGVMVSHRNIMPHLHLALQSGSNRILKKMRRQYTAERFLEKVQMARAKLDRPAITTDIIVGFPGETDCDFSKTMELARDVGFAKMHVFTFSPRKGTPASKMQDTVDNTVIKERSKILRDLDVTLGRGFRSQFIGQKAVVLVENVDGQPSGRCERYFNVKIRGNGKEIKKNDLVQVELIKALNNGAVGELLGEGNWIIK